MGRNRRQFIELDKDNIKVETFDNAKRQVPGHKAGDAKHTFRDLRSTFTEEQVQKEANRCLGCGATVVDPNKCIGCGICTTKCEFDAIHLSRDLPDASRMVKSEDKLKAIFPYMLKREIKIKFRGRKKIKAGCECMHELGIIIHISKTLKEVAEENEVTKIGSVTLEIGEASGIVPEYLLDCHGLPEEIRTCYRNRNCVSRRFRR